MVCDPARLYGTVAAKVSLPLIFWLVGLGVVTAVIPFGLYTIGLKYTAASKAAVVACSEPVAATLFGLAVYSEMPSLTAYVGILLILAAIILLNVRTKRK